MQIDTQHEIGQMDVELLNEHMGLVKKYFIIHFEDNAVNKSHWK